MLVESFVCPTCGAPKGVVPNSLVVYCDHCGGVVAYDSTHEASARSGGLSGITAENWPRTQQWMAASVAMGQLLAQDAEAGAQFARVGQAATALCGPLATRDPLEPARHLLAAWRGFYNWIAKCLPDHAAVLQSEAFARSGMRSSLRGMQLLLGEGTVAHLRHEILGDAVVRMCVQCGAALEVHVDTCRFCGTSVRVEAEDPWLAGVITAWAPMQQILMSEGKLDSVETPMGAIQVTLSAVIMGTGKVTPEGAYGALVQLVPWVPKSRMLEAIRSMQAWTVPAAKGILEKVRKVVEASWHTDPSRRPVKK